MSATPFTPAARPARPSAPGARIAHACLLAMLEALILSFLLRLPSRTRRLLGREGDILPHTTLAAFAPDAPPHAPFVALGLIPDWILPRHPSRAMRCTPVPRPRPPVRRTARAPPAHPPPAPNTPSSQGAKPRP